MANVNAAVAGIEAALNRMSLLPHEADAAAAEIEQLIETPGVASALTGRVAHVAVACLSEAADSSEPSPVAVKWCCLVLGCVEPRHLPKDLAGVIVDLLTADPVRNHPDAVFHVLDLLATVTAANAAMRAQLGEGGVFPALLAVARGHKKNMLVLFGVAFAIGSLTMADVVNGNRAVEAGALQVLIETFKAAVRAGRVVGGGTSGNEEDADVRRDVKRYAREAIFNLTKVPFEAADKAFAGAKWGQFGDLIDVDELQLDVDKERRRCVALLAAFRKQQATTA